MSVLQVLRGQDLPVIGQVRLGQSLAWASMGLFSWTVSARCGTGKEVFATERCVSVRLGALWAFLVGRVGEGPVRYGRARLEYGLVWCPMGFISRFGRFR